MNLIEIANILMRAIDGTQFKVDYTPTSLILWGHGEEPLKFFVFFQNNTEEENLDELKKAINYIELIRNKER